LIERAFHTKRFACVAPIFAIQNVVSVSVDRAHLMPTSRLNRATSLAVSECLSSVIRRSIAFGMAIDQRTCRRD